MPCYLQTISHSVIINNGNDKTIDGINITNYKVCIHQYLKQLVQTTHKNTANKTTTSNNMMPSTNNVLTHKNIHSSIIHANNTNYPDYNTTDSTTNKNKDDNNHTRTHTIIQTINTINIGTDTDTIIDTNAKYRKTYNNHTQDTINITITKSHQPTKNPFSLLAHKQELPT